MQTIVRALIRREQNQEYLNQVAAGIDHHAADGTSSYLFANDAPEGDTFQIGAQDVTCRWDGLDLVLTAPGAADARTAWLIQSHGSQQTLAAHAKEIHIRVQPNSSGQSATGPPADRMNVNLELFNVMLETPGGVRTPRGGFRARFPCRCPIRSAPSAKSRWRIFCATRCRMRAIPRLASGPGGCISRTCLSCTTSKSAPTTPRSELHGRASFAVSCLSLVMVGCALGVTFRSGNFLNAFAASFVPALLCITLIISGQQSATHVPFTTGAAFKGPLPTALVFIWMGNVAVLFAAIWLTVRLQRR